VAWGYYLPLEKFKFKSELWQGSNFRRICKMECIVFEQCLATTFRENNGDWEILTKVWSWKDHHDRLELINEFVKLSVVVRLPKFELILEKYACKLWEVFYYK
jgi:hypothetical protein